MKTRQAFAKSLREVRKTRRLTQEDFSVVSSRTNISLLERAGANPSLGKIESIAETLKVHPFTLLTLTYIKAGGHRNANDLFKKVRSELAALDEAAKDKKD